MRFTIAAVLFFGTTAEGTPVPTTIPTSYPSPVPTGAFPAEKFALERLYKSTGGDKGSWISKTHWMDMSTHVCKWYGVKCGSSLGTVTKLQLSSNNLAGTLPTEIGLMTNADELHLDNNAVSSSCPSELGLIRSVKKFSLYENSLKGGVPVGHIFASFHTTSTSLTTPLVTTNPPTHPPIQP